MNDPKDATILIVDDDPTLRLILDLEFKRKGFNVLTAASGREAISIWHNRKVSLILSDIQMENGDGFELLDAVRKVNPNFPVVVFMTGFSKFSREEAKRRGAYDTLAKPIDRVIMHKLINEILQSVP
jgi:DNA-binding NtrC family response regulator